MTVSSKSGSIKVYLGNEKQGNKLNIPVDYIVTGHKKIVPIILSKLNLNQTIFARNCKLEKLDKTSAEDFFNTWKGKCEQLDDLLVIGIKL